MAKNTLYAVLGLSPSTTGLEIRAVYQCLIARVHAGEIPPEEVEAIEEAYATLGNPVRRLHYDIQLTAPSLPEQEEANEKAHEPGGTPIRRLRHDAQSAVSLPPDQRQVIKAIHPTPAALAPLLRWRPAMRMPVLAAAVAFLASVGMLALLLPLSGGRHTSSKPAQPVTSRTISPVADPQGDLAIGSSVPNDPAQGSLGSPASSEETSVPASSPEPEEASAPIASPTTPPPTPARASVLADRAPVRAPAAAPAQAAPSRRVPEAGPLQTATLSPAAPDPEWVPPPSIADAPQLPGPTSPALVQSSSFGTSRAAARVVGQYCRDATGGEIFVVGGGPAPASLAC